VPTTDESTDSARAAALAAWIRDQPIARRTRAALLRDLDRAGAERDGEAGESQLASLDPEAFVAQLHTPDGGPIARVRGIGARALSGLRRALPLRAPSQPDTRAEADAPAAAAPPAPVVPPDPAADSAPLEAPAAPGLTLDAAITRPAPNDSAGAAHTVEAVATPPGDSEAPGPPDDTGAALVAAASGLLVPSESDSPLTLFRHDGAAPPTPATMLAQLGLPPTTPVETRTLDEFFAPLTAVAEWMDDAQRGQAARFAELRAQILARLSDIVVYRFGRVRVTVLIVGRAPAGDIVGLTATLIET
jgi:hypothetical protein